MNKLLSILVISQSGENLRLLLDSINVADTQDFTFEVLCSWNGKKKCPIKSADYKFDFVVVDKKPYNFSKNNNHLADLAKGEFVLFINDDVIVDEECLSKSMKAIQQSSVGIVGVNLRYANDRVQHAGMYFKEDKLPYHRYKNQLHYLDPRVVQTINVPAVTGAYLLIGRQEFLTIKFDEDCEVAAQDVILCIHYRQFFAKDILYVGDATAVHYENVTRKLYDQRITPKADIQRIIEAFATEKNEAYQKRNERIKLRIITEKPGWIMHRKAEEIAKRLPNAVINEDYPDANIHYYINYGFLKEKPKSGLVLANFTHYDAEKLADSWQGALKMVDHCVAVSNLSAKDVTRFGVSDEKVTIIPVGADNSYKPKLTLGLVGRTYPGGRKGEELVQALLQDDELMQDMQIVAAGSDTWGVPVWEMEDQADFYRSIDYLLVPALIEGGPVPFMEALACGTLSIAPPIGVVPDFPHIEYKTGNIDSLKAVITKIKNEHLERKRRFSQTMEFYDWEHWASAHIALFNRLLDECS